MDDNAALLYLNLAVVEALEKSFEEAMGHLDEAKKYFDEYPDGRAVELVLCANGPEVKEHGFEPFLVVEDAHKDGVIAMNKAAVIAREDAGERPGGPRRMGGLPGGGPDRQLFQPAERAAWLGQFRVTGAGALHRFLVWAGKGADQLGDAGEIRERDGGMVGCHGSGPPEARAAGA